MHLSNATAPEFVELRLSQEAAERQGIPRSGLWMRQEALEAIIERGGQYSIDDLIYGLLDWLQHTDNTVTVSNLRALLQQRLR